MLPRFGVFAGKGQHIAQAHLHLHFLVRHMLHLGQDFEGGFVVLAGLFVGEVAHGFLAGQHQVLQRLVEAGAVTVVAG